MINEQFGWIWITAGFLSGAVLGVFFSREGWMGGYQSYRRRLLRLGHISFVGLGILNILFAVSAPRLALAPQHNWLASWSLMIGGVAMPLSCGLTAWKPSFKPLFVVPVTTLLTGASLVSIGLAQKGCMP